MDFKTAKQIFMRSKDSQNISSTTIRQYNMVLRKFLLFAMENNVFSIEDLDGLIIEKYFASFKQSAKPIRGITLQGHYRVLRTFCIYLYQNDFIDRNPIKFVKQPKAEKKIMRTFTAQEIKLILNSFDRSDYYGMRDYTIVSLMFSSGLRKREITSIEMNDFTIGGDMLKVHGKGAKERLIPIGRAMSRILKQYRTSREDFLTVNRYSSPFLFVSRQGTPLSIFTMQDIFYRIKDELQIPGERVSCHTWRHTFAKNYLLNGGDIFSLQKIMGHADIATTKQYLNLNENEVKAQHAKFNPLDNMDWLI